MDSINKREKRNKGEVRVEFSGKNITPYGGLGLFHKFSRKLGVEKALDRDNNIGIDEGEYGIGRKIMSLVYGLVCGLEHPSDTKVLQKDKVFQTIIGYNGYPDQSILSRFLKLFSVSGANEIGVQNSRMLLRVRHKLRGPFQADFGYGLACQDSLWEPATSESGL